MIAAPKDFRIRSFVRRSGRRTEGQERARAELEPLYGLSVAQGMLDYSKVFGRKAPCFLEIGFGSGQSLIALADAERDKDFIGVETHQPGIGALFLGMQQHTLTNVRVYDADVIDVFDKCIPDDSLAGVQIFFPDPWQKRRHHARRLIQPEFLQTVVRKLQKGGELHLATDWEDYSKHMMLVVSANKDLLNLAGEGQFAERSKHRPIQTKFERRAVRDGRGIWELQFRRQT